MKKNNKKGFTIVELVIVIAVIGILAAVLIPTFGGIIEDANKAAAQSEAQSLYKQIYTEDLKDGKADGKNASGTDLARPTGVTYTPTAAAGSEIFKYVDGKYTVSYNGTTWTTTP